MAKTKAAKPATHAPGTPEAALIATAGTDDLLTTKADDVAAAGGDWKNLERHPLSAKYGPPVSDEERLGLATDIEQNGQHEAIKLYEGKVLAGWNRYQACLAKNIVPRLETYTGDKAEAVAFGTNVIRRRLSSIAKAYMGAKFYIATAGKQQDIAKQCAVSLNRLNQCAQLLRLDTEEALRAQEVLANNPEVTGPNFDEMLLECGIASMTPRKPATNVTPIRGGASLDDDLDLEDPLGDDDLTGNAIDDLLDDELADPDGGSTDPATPRKPALVGEGKPPKTTAGTTPTKPTETPVSKLARFYKGLTTAEQVQFVKFAWGTLRPALDTAILAGLVYDLPKPPAPKKPKGSAHVKALAAVAPAKEKKPQPPALAAAAAKRAAAKKTAAAAEPAKKPAAKKAKVA